MSDKLTRFRVKTALGDMGVEGEPVGNDLMLVGAPSGAWIVFSRTHGLPLPFGKFTNEFDARRFLRCIRHLPWQEIATEKISRQQFIKKYYHELRFAHEAVIDVLETQDPEIRFKAYMHRLHKRSDLQDYILGK